MGYTEALSGPFASVICQARPPWPTDLGVVPSPPRVVLRGFLSDQPLGGQVWVGGARDGTPGGGALDPSSFCCLCPGGRTMDSSAGGKARPEAGEDKEGFLSKLKKMFTS